MTNPTHLQITFHAFDQLDLPRGLILDVGCSEGYCKYEFINRGFNWVGCDNQFEQQNMPIVKNNAENLKDFADHSIDIIFACHVLEHIERPIDALREFKRVLKDDGFLFISMPLLCEHQLKEADHIFVMNEQQVLKWLSYVKFIWSMYLYNKNNDCVEQGSQFFLCRKKDDWKMLNTKCSKCGKEKKAFNHNLISSCCEQQMEVIENV